MIQTIPIPGTECLATVAQCPNCSQWHIVVLDAALEPLGKPSPPIPTESLAWIMLRGLVDAGLLGPNAEGPLGLMFRRGTA